MAASCAAQEDNQTSSNESETLSDSEMLSENEVLWMNMPDNEGQEESEFANNYNDLYSYFNEAPQAEPISLAFPIADLNGDSAYDILVLKIANDPYTNAFNTEISAMSGSNGTELWAKEYPNSLAIAYPAGDISGDNLSDVVIDVIVGGMNFIPYSEVSALFGSNGTEIWSRPHPLAITFAYPIENAAEGNATDLVEHLFGIDSINGSLVTKISTVNGSSGTDLSSRIFIGGVAAEYPVGNLTSDDVGDSITAIYKLNETSPENITSILVATSGSNREELWSASFNDSLGIAVPIQDISGDSLDDLLVYMLSNNTTITFEMAALQGIDGQMLWRRSFGESPAIAFGGPDLTGEGKGDLIVYRMNEFGESEMEAVKGDDGSILWTKPMMIFIPQ